MKVFFVVVVFFLLSFFFFELEFSRCMCNALLLGSVVIQLGYHIRGFYSLAEQGVAFLKNHILAM